MKRYVSMSLLGFRQIKTKTRVNGRLIRDIHVEQSSSLADANFKVALNAQFTSEIINSAR